MSNPSNQPLAPYGGRRFVLTIGASLLCTMLLVADLIGEDSYIALQMMTVGAFMAASAAQHIAHENAEGKRNADRP